jgi:hypothetical protein
MPQAHSSGSARTNRRLASWKLGLIVGIVAFVPRVATALAGLAHRDEQKWLQRSEHYVHALLSGDLANATSISASERSHTMPGITTVLVGGVARLIWGGVRDLRATSFPGELFDASRPALIIAQLLMAAATSGLLVLLWWVLSTWSTRVVATTAALILATEPILVADGVKLATDSFLVLFGAIGAFALAAALGVPARPNGVLTARQRRVLAIVAGIGVGGAALSKLTAVTIGPFLLGLVVYACVRARRRNESVRDVLTDAGIVAAVAIVLMALFWPAAWSDPSGQLEVLRGTAELPGQGQSQFFLGEMTDNPSPLFYFVVVPLRMTPWFFLVSIPALVLSLRVRALRGFALVGLAYAAVPWVTILLSDKKFERYAFLVWPVLAILVGLLVQHIAARCRAAGPDRVRAFEVAAVGVVTGVFVYTLLVVPHGSAYTNPALGGAPVAGEVMLLDIGGPNATEAGLFIRDREGDRCNERQIWAMPRPRLWFPCGDRDRTTEQLRDGDYIVLFDDFTKRRTPELVQAYRGLGRRIAVIRVRGAHIADIYRVANRSEPAA